MQTDSEDARNHSASHLFQRLIFGSIDAMWYLTTAYKSVSAFISSIFTVTWDPFGISRNLIQSGRSRFVVVAADSEYERRVAAWFYRNYEAPEMEDWEECAKWFKLEDICHKLRFDDFPFDVEVVLFDDRRFLKWGVKTINEKIPLGGCSPDRMLNSIFKIESMYTQSIQ